MAKDDEIPDWAGAQDFYEKYDPKEILGRYCHIVTKTCSGHISPQFHISPHISPQNTNILFYFS